MSKEAFIRAAYDSPQPAREIHNEEGGGVSYCCHSAMMHWAFMALGETHQGANALVSKLSTLVCRACNNRGGIGGHESISFEWYGSNFCTGAVEISNRMDLTTKVNVGDVLITSRPEAPMHSMVVVKIDDSHTPAIHNQDILKKGHLELDVYFSNVYIRGFNNAGTFPGAGRSVYDDHDRDVTAKTNWYPEGFGVQGGLYVIPFEKYIASAAAARRTINLRDLGHKSNNLRSLLG